MVRSVLTLGCFVLFMGAVAPAQAGCPGCEDVAKKGEGFHCGQGLVFGLKLSSEKLYQAVAGKEVDVEGMKCPGCVTAAKTNGVCAHCKVAMSGGKMYRSMAAYTLAKGSPIAEGQECSCPGCKTARAEDGFCSACEEGFVSGRLFKGKESHDAALAAHKTLASAIDLAKHCVGCGIAAVTDGTCPSCKVSYKDGKKTG